MPSENVLELTRKYLNSNYINVHEEWLIECLEHFLESSTETDIEEIQNNVKEQWCLHDLRNICPGSLPANLKYIEETTLPSVYVLQINSLFDIGRPAYQQYLDLKKIDTENIEATNTYEERIKACRMLKMIMTDGVQEIIGIEYKTIKSLSVNTTPGIKVIIKGPVKCRKGTLLLTDKNFELLDGEVDSLMTENSQSKLLHTKLGLINVPDDPEATSQLRINQPAPDVRLPDPPSAPSMSSNLPSASRTVPAASRITESLNTFKEPSSRSDFFETEESAFGTAAVTSRMKESSSFKEPSNASLNSRLNNFETEDSEFDALDTDIDPSEIDQIEAQYSGVVRKLSDDATAQPEKKFKMDRNDEFPIDDDENLFDADMFFDEPVKKEIYTINEINNIEDKNGKVFVVRARILTMLSKLSLSKTAWKSSCRLTDGGGALDVALASAALQQVVGHSPAQMNAMKKQLKIQPELKEKLSLIIEQARKKFQALNCKMKIEFKSSTDIPTLIEFIDL